MPDEVLELSDVQILWAIQNVNEDISDKNELIKDLIKSFIHILYPKSTIDNKKEKENKEQENNFFNELVEDGAKVEDIEELKRKSTVYD